MSEGWGWGREREGRGGGKGVTSYIWHTTDLRSEWPTFSTLPSIWLAPFFQQNIIWLTLFSLIRMWKDPIIWHQGKCVRDLSRLLVLMVFNELTAIFVLLPAINGYKSQRAVYEWVNILDDQVYEWVCFFKGKVYEWGRFGNAGLHTRISFTPKLNM